MTSMAAHGEAEMVPADDQQENDNQAEQRRLVQRGAALPGVADVLNVYGRLSAYQQVLVNVQLSQVRNATGGNVA